MPYIGAKELKASDIRRFDVTSSTSATHTLTWTPPTEQSLIVTINGIKQHEDAYSVSGTTLTLSSPLVATDKLEVIGINDIGTTITPAQNSVDTDKIANNAVTTAKIADDQITSAKLANAINITSGNSLTIDSGATITNNGTASGFGKLLQVQSYSAGITFSGTGDSSLSVSITPSSASNKIFIIATLARASGTGADGSNAYFGFKRNTTSLGNFANLQTDSNRDAGHTLSYLDSPSSTSSQTYLVTGNSAKISATANSTITVMEIAG